jgi:hypothetical protein
VAQGEGPEFKPQDCKKKKKKKIVLPRSIIAILVGVSTLYGVCTMRKITQGGNSQKYLSLLRDAFKLGT